MPISTHNIREFWGENFYRHSANLILFVTFYVFLKSHFKKRKKSCFFLKMWKKYEIRIVEHWTVYHDVVTQSMSVSSQSSMMKDNDDDDDDSIDEDVVLLLCTQYVATYTASFMIWWNCLKSAVLQPAHAISSSVTTLIADTSASRWIYSSHPTVHIITTGLSVSCFLAQGIYRNSYAIW